jgi:hypothetical protein
VCVHHSQHPHVRCDHLLEPAFSALATGLESPGSANLTRLMVSPSSMLPSLQMLDSSNCKNLQYVVVQSINLESLLLSNCRRLTGGACKSLRCLNGCGSLVEICLWVNVSVDLDVNCSHEIDNFRLFCGGVIVSDVRGACIDPGVILRTKKVRLSGNICMNSWGAKHHEI